MSHRARRFAVVFTPFACVFLAAAAYGQSTAPSTPTTQPSTAPSISPQAREMIEQIKNAYGKLDSLQLAGSVTFDADVAGDERHQTAEFSGAFRAPNKFRHEMKDDLTIVGTGEKLFTYLPSRNQYVSVDQPNQRTSELPNEVGDLLREQDPSLCLALSSDASADLMADATAIDKIADVKLDGRDFAALKITTADRDVTLLVDPGSGMLRQMQVDLKKMFDARDVPQVKKALVTIDYSKTSAGDAIDASKFSFTVPAGAQLVKAEALAAQPEDADAAQELVGKDAPPFKLENLEGKEISPTTDFKGSVIVLDFWATWCPPCREGLPHLDELYKSKEKDGVKIFAVNLREEKEKAGKFMSERSLSLPVLLDTSGATATAYRVGGIPQTVVIGKDGKIRSVFVGFGEESAKSLSDAVTAALAER